MNNIEPFPGVAAPAGLGALADVVLEAMPCAVVTVAEDGKVRAHNARAVALFGRPLRVGNENLELLLYAVGSEPMPLPARSSLITAALAGETSYGRQVAIERPDGARTLALASTIPLRREDGSVEGACVTFEDASASQHALEAANQKEARLLELVQALPAAVYTTDAEGRVTFYNRAAAELAGREPEIGKDRWCVAASLKTSEGAALPLDQCPMAIALKENRPVRNVELIAERPDGSEVPLLPFPTPIRDRNGALLGGVNMLIDVSRLKYAESVARGRMSELSALYGFSRRAARADTLAEIEEAALDALMGALHCDRAALLLFDEDKVMRFRAARGLSEDYKGAVEGHSPWIDGAVPEPICIDDVKSAHFDPALAATIAKEGIVALAFVPVTAHGALVGKFMAYFNQAHAFDADEINLAMTLARQLGFTIERARAQMALRESEERFRLVSESAPVMLWMGDASGKCVYLNRQLREFWGLQLEDIANFSWDATLHPDDVAGLHAKFAQAMAMQTAFEVEARYRRADGASRILRTQAQPRFGASREFLGMIGVNIDVTDERAAENALRDSEARFRAMADSAPAPIWVIDAPGRVEFVNNAMCAFVGKSVAEFRDDTWISLVHPDDVAEVKAIALEAWRNGPKPYTFEARFRNASGAWRWLNAHASPRLSANAEFSGYVGIAMDVTEAKRAQAALQANEQRLRLAVEASKAADWSWDALSDRVRLSPMAAQLLDLPAECSWESLGLCLHPEDRGALRAKADGAIADKSRFEVDCRLAVNSISGASWISVRGQGVYSANGQVAGMIGLIADCTERKRQEDAERLLIREVDHRAKNVLAVVQAMARLTPFESRQQYLQDFTGRVGALGRVHTLLSNSRWKCVSLDDIVRQELEPHAKSNPQCIDVHGPSVDLKPEMGQPISIIMHELATNAAKYGALAKTAGVVSVIWCQRPGGGLLIDWSESGAELWSKTAIKEGFGTTLIDSAVKQLGGAIRRTWTEDGLKCVIELVPDVALTFGRYAPPRSKPSETKPARISLNNVRVLIVEDEPLVALELQTLLQQVGATIVGPVASLDEALLIAVQAELDCALLDVNLSGRHSGPLVELLSNRGIPHVLLTGYQDPGVSGPVLHKPITADQVLHTVARLISDAPVANV